MKKIQIIALSTAVLFAACTTAKKTAKNNTNPTFKTTASGLEYMMVIDAPGTQTPNEGDYVELHITTTNHNDSLIFDSRTLKNGDPAQFQIKNPSFNGDLSEGIMMMTAGDSAVFKIIADSLIAAGQGLQAWMDTGKKITYTIKLVSVKTEAQLQKEQKIKASSQTAMDEKKLTEYFAKNNIKAIKTASGLYYQVLEPGTGDLAKAGQTVDVNYTGMLLDGTKFDSNVDPQFQHVEPLSFQLGQGRVIKGWDEGLALLNKGAKAKLFIPSNLAYGSQSPAPSIPPNSILVFEVELLNIK